MNIFTELLFLNFSESQMFSRKYLLVLLYHLDTYYLGISIKENGIKKSEVFWQITALSGQY